MVECEIWDKTTHQFPLFSIAFASAFEYYSRSESKDYSCFLLWHRAIPSSLYEQLDNSVSLHNMSYNQILSKKTVGTVVKNGREITISVATRTSKWFRLDIGVDAIANPFVAAVEDFKGELPEDTQDVCARSWVIRSSLSNTNPGNRESEHTSKDPRQHFTGSTRKG